MLKEFKEFAMKGNLVDMAVAFVMGAAFTKLVTAFIQGLVMPVVGLVAGGVNFAHLKFVLKPEQVDAAGKVIQPENAILYGNFISVTIDFLLVALVMFFIIKVINSLKRKEEKKISDEPAPTPEDIALLREIRDSLQK